MRLQTVIGRHFNACTYNDQNAPLLLSSFPPSLPPSLPLSVVPCAVFSAESEVYAMLVSEQQLIVASYNISSGKLKTKVISCSVLSLSPSPSLPPLPPRSPLPFLQQKAVQPCLSLYGGHIGTLSSVPGSLLSLSLSPPLPSLPPPPLPLPSFPSPSPAQSATRHFAQTDFFALYRVLSTQNWLPKNGKILLPI